jgi:hypothetical protein
MALFQSILDFFESLFMSSSPEVQRKQQLKKINSELRTISPVIYRNDMVQPNFAEALRILYIHTKPIEEILYKTISGDDVTRNRRFESQLLITGYSPADQDLLASLSYINRKEEVKNSSTVPLRVFENQHRILDKLIKSLNTKEFIRIDIVFSKLKQLTDFCRFNYFTSLQIFDHSFVAADPSYIPDFQPQPIQSLETVILDLYYLIADFTLNSSVVNAVLALDQLRNSGEISEDRRAKIIGHFKKIITVITRILTPAVLKKLICLAKGDPSFVPKAAAYKYSTRQQFATHLQEQFEADERRIKVEIQDETIRAELTDLFDGRPLESVDGYNGELNETLQANTSVSLLWITPLQVIKTFLQLYISEGIKAVLNDIVIEGFFNNPAYKSSFSSLVYTTNDSAKRIKKFEDSFARGGPNDQAIITGFIRDSHKDPDFGKKLTSKVDAINMQTKQLIQNEVSNLFSLYNHIGDLLSDAKKPTCEIVSNLKVLIMSSRNRDNTDLLERQIDSWKIFFDIMKNYAIIGNVERK